MELVSLQLDSFQSLLWFCLRTGSAQIGQVVFTRDLRIFHVEDATCKGLRVYTDPEAAKEIARFDDTGRYRPLKSAPDLCRGWELRLASAKALHIAIDFFYPAAMGLWMAMLKGRLVGTPLRTTLDRQSGMYRIAAQATDRQAIELMQNFCKKKCLRKILWRIHHTTTRWEQKSSTCETSTLEIPLLCSEACNLFVAAVRRMVKKSIG